MKRDTTNYIDINNYKHVYLLGLFWADACLHMNKKNYFQFSYECKPSDFKDNETLFNSLNCGHISKRNKSLNSKLYSSITFNLGKQETCKFLYDLDFSQKSSIAPTKILNIIPNNLKHYFWRGYFDGDGCLHVTNNKIELAFWSTINQDWSEFIKLLNDLNIDRYFIFKYKRNNGKHCSSCIGIRRANYILKFMEYIYQGDFSIGLTRKYNKYLELCKLLPTLRLDTTSKFKGVCFNKRNNNWKATIYKNKVNKLSKHLHLGWFKTENEAQLAIENRLKELNITNELDKISIKEFVSK